MVIDSQQVDDLIIVRIDGTLDSVSCQDFETYLLGLVKDAKQLNFAIDFNNIHFICSYGLRILILTAKIIALRKGKIYLFGINADVYDIFCISGFSTFFSIHSSLDEALSFSNKNSHP